MQFPCRLAALVAGLCLSIFSTHADHFSLHTRSRVKDTNETSGWKIVEREIQWDPAGTAVVVCDMWDQHWCPDATERVGQMAPVMNQVLKAARARGALILHCPSETMEFYKDTPQRKLAQAAPKVETKVPLKGWCSLTGEKEPPLPIDDSDGGCDTCSGCKQQRAWSRQHPAIEIMPEDAITDSAEAFYLMKQRGITNVLVMGVHANMCVLGRPFSIRQMVAQGQNVLLMRDMTDSMYNHQQRPFTSHFRGTELVVEHIEKYWCPSITSADFLGGEPFRFKGDKPPRVACILGENEYHTWETLPPFLEKEIASRGARISYVTAPPVAGAMNFTNWEAIRDADLLVVSVRRRTPPIEMMNLIKAHVAAGKPVVGIRTASHAFDAKPPDAEHASWPEWDHEILGGDYQNHFGTK